MRNRHVLLPGVILLGALLAAASLWQWRAHEDVRKGDLHVNFGLLSGGVVDAAYTCDGLGQNMPISITKYPDGTHSFALLLEDVSLDNAIHWLMWDIPVTQTDIKQGTRPDGAMARAYDGNFHFAPVCPPAKETHTYRLTVFALPDSTLKMGSGTDTSTAIRTIRDHSYGTATMTATYARSVSQ